MSRSCFGSGSNRRVSARFTASSVTALLVAVLLILFCSLFPAEASELKTLEENMIVISDESEGIAWLRDRLSPAELSEKQGTFQIRIMKTADAMMPRLLVGYVADEWLYMDEVIVDIDGQIGRIRLNPSAVMRSIYSQTSRAKTVTPGKVGGVAVGIGGYAPHVDTNEYYYWESTAIAPETEYDLEGLRILAVAASQGGEVAVRIKGSSGQYEFRLDEEQKTALGRIWRYYELLAMPDRASASDTPSKPDSYYDSRIEQYRKNLGWD